ncbi:MAG: DUF4168 domain-containing protein [Deferribacterota bacterium]|nr:DUF4168 domain-containing protein [Deferribacterota bacterium]
MFKKVFTVSTVILTIFMFNLGITNGQSKQKLQNPNLELNKQEKTENIDKETLDNFISAAKEIENTKRKYMMKYQKEAQKEMSDILKKHNLDVETYNKIGNAINNDPELMEKVRNKLSEEVK